jgi:hypothetical protein
VSHPHGILQRRTLTRFRRPIILALVVLAGILLPALGMATPLSPFIDLQEKGLTVVADGEGLQSWGGGPSTFTVNIGGPVRFALLYWIGRQRPDDNPSGTSTCNDIVVPYRDQQLIFDGISISGTDVGTECQPVSGNGPILNVAYFADVTSIVSAKGTGLQSFTLSDGDLADNLWRLNGAVLFVAYTNPLDSNWYRVLVWDGMDFAFGIDPTPGDTRVTAPVSFNHGANLSARTAQLWIGSGDSQPVRPDRISISNNADLINTLDSSTGHSLDFDEINVNIPAGVGSTTVQLFSEPLNQNPDSMLWTLAALRVRQLDFTKARCPITLNDPGPPARVEVTVQDTGTGLAEILVTRSENADTVVPPFTVGTTSPVVISSTKIDQTQRARVEARVTDLAGNVALCDPILVLVSRDNNVPVVQSHTDVPLEEDTVTITNGTPGLNSVEVIVNGQKFKAHLKDGEEKTLDISSALVAGDNTVTLRGLGKKGGSASVMIWDGESN